MRTQLAWLFQSGSVYFRKIQRASIKPTSDWGCILMVLVVKFCVEPPETRAVIMKSSAFVLGKKQAKNSRAKFSDAAMLVIGRSAKMDIRYKRQLQRHCFV